MQAVNLLPEYARGGKRWTTTGAQLSSRRILPIGGAAAAVLAIAIGLLYLHERSVVSSKKSELATAEARLVAQDARAEPIKAAQADVQARLASMKTITAARVHWDNALADLAHVLPADVHLSSLSASSPTPAASLATPATTTAQPAAPVAAAPVPGTVNFTIAGTTTSYDRVALILDRLALLPWLQDVTLQSTSQPAQSPASFTIGADYIGGGDS